VGEGEEEMAAGVSGSEEARGRGLGQGAATATGGRRPPLQVGPMRRRERERERGGGREVGARLMGRLGRFWPAVRVSNSFFSFYSLLKYK
jgi:hypothetical protein